MSRVARLETQPQGSIARSVEEIETKLLLDGVALRYGYDFREYAIAPLKRSIASVFSPESSRYEQLWDGVSLFHKVR